MRESVRAVLGIARTAFASAAIAATFAPALAPDPARAQERADSTKAGAPAEESRVAVEIPLVEQTRAGVRFAPAVRKRIAHSIRAVGTVSADERREAHVQLRVSGWIEKLHADFTGKLIRAGDPLFSLYSPEVASTEEELLSALRAGKAGREIADAARERLLRWGVPPKEIQRLERERRVSRSILFESPANGTIVRKGAVRGMYVTPAMELFHIAELGRVWVQLSLYEFDVAAIRVGDSAQVTFPFDTSLALSAEVTFISPEVDPETRTARARVELPNPRSAIKPGMFAEVEIRKDLGEALVVPDDSVIDTGLRRIAFARSGPTRLEPRALQLGPRVGGEWVVLGGLGEGEEVVTGASFLVDAESKMRAAVSPGASGSPPPGPGHSGHGGM